MKIFKFWGLIVSILTMLILPACGDGGGSGGSGTVTMSITDAKPLLPEGATNLWVTFTEVLVHKSGGDWKSLPLVEAPYTIDLLQFYDGNTTELVPPTELEYGKYTQIRIVVSSATIRFDKDSRTEDYTVEIPSGNLKTDKNFTFDVQDPAAVDIMIDFDLSKSLVVTESSGATSYKLKPVLHIVETLKAATIHGRIDNTSFVDPHNAIVTVFADDGQEEYTKVEVSKSDTEDPTEFSIYWLVPNEDYIVEIDFDPDIEGPEYDEDVLDLKPGEVFELNEGNPIYSKTTP